MTVLLQSGFMANGTVVMISEVQYSVLSCHCLSTEGYPFGFQFVQLPCLLPTDFTSNPVFPQLLSSKLPSAKNI